MLPDDDRTAHAEAAVWLTLIQEGVAPVGGVFERNVATGLRVAAVEGAVLSDDVVGPALASPTPGDGRFGRDADRRWREREVPAVARCADRYLDASRAGRVRDASAAVAILLARSSYALSGPRLHKDLRQTV